MHPGPMNRGVEIDSDVADLPQSVIEEQVTNGIAVRMSLLYLMLGGSSEVSTAMSERVILQGGTGRRPGRRDGRRRATSSSRAGGSPTIGDGALEAGDAEVIDCAGLIVAPGLVDMHTHLREPGFEHKETIETGTRAAAVGGYTAVAPMANTEPVADHAGVIHEVRDLAAAAGLCDVFPVGAITKGLEGESLAEIGEMVEAGVRMFSDDGRCVPTARLLRNALVYAKAFDDVVIAEHCEDASLAENGQMHEGFHSYSLGLAGPAGRGGGSHRRPRPRDRAHDRHAAPPLPSVVGPLGRAGASREGRGHPRDRRGHAAPSGVHRRRPRHLRHEPEGEPAAAERRGSRRAACGRGRRDDRRDRDGSRAARGRGEGGGVRSVAARDDRTRDGARGRAHRAGRAGHPDARPRARGPVDDAGADPRSRRARRARSNRAGPPTSSCSIRGSEWVVEAPFASKSRNSAFLGSTLRGRVVHTMFRGELTVTNGKATR